MYSGTMTLAGWPDAAYEDQSPKGKCRLGYVLGLLSSTPSGPCRLRQWTSKFTRKLVKSSLGAEAYASSKIMDRAALLRELLTPFADFPSGMVGMEDCESLRARHRN